MAPPESGVAESFSLPEPVFYSNKLLNASFIDFTYSAT